MITTSPRTILINALTTNQMKIYNFNSTLSQHEIDAKATTTILIWINNYSEKNFITILLISSAPFLLVILLILFIFAILSRIFTIHKMRKRKRQTDEISAKSIYPNNSKIDISYTRPSIRQVSEEREKEELEAGFPRTSTAINDKSIINAAYLNNEIKKEGKTRRNKHTLDDNESINNRDSEKIFNKVGSFINRDPVNQQSIPEPKIIKIDSTKNSDDAPMERKNKFPSVPIIIIHEASDNEDNNDKN